jgi:uncharacterized membrane protein YphA (DoxX/SURF4 family)
MMQKVIDQFSRFFVGGLFIFSGLIKLNDPVGTQIKLEEYFEVFSQDIASFFHVFIPYALEIGLFLVVLEVVLGFALLFNYKMNNTTWILLLLMIFFTALTFYSAYFNKVTDCGCFGDAIKLTPWQSFWKDIVLMVFVLHLFWYRKKYLPVFYTNEGNIVMGSVTIVAITLGIYAIRHLPFIDFRAYKIGNNIPQQMQPQEQAIIEYVFEKEGAKIKSQKYLMPADGYTYVESKVLNADKTLPKITDYNVLDADGQDVTQQTFEGSKLLIIIGNVEKASTSNLNAIRELINGVEQTTTKVMILTSSSSQDIDAFRHQHQLAAPFYFVDATVLKTIVRANPGITLWHNGVVKGMWHHNDTPTAEEILKLIE